MNEYHPSDDSLEQRLHSLYNARLGPPPEASHVRRQVARLIAQHRRSDQFHGDTAMQPSSSPIAPQKRLRSRLTWIGSAAAVILIAALTLAGYRAFRPGSSHTTPISHVTPPAATPIPVPFAPLDAWELNDISMTSTKDGWAVGAYWHLDPKTEKYSGIVYPPPSGEIYALFEHYHDGTWTSSMIDLGVKGEDLQPSGLSSVSMDSPTDGWAVGGTAGSSRTQDSVIFHYDGHTWTRQSVPSGTGNLWSVQMLSPSDGWAVGGISPTGTILHYDGTSWQIFTQEHIGQGFLFNSLSMISPDEGWATGIAWDHPHPDVKNNTYFPLHEIVLRYQNGTWMQVTSVLNFMGSVSLLSDGSGWAAGNVYPHGTFTSETPVVYRIHNGQWTKQSIKIDSPTQWGTIDAVHGWLSTANGTTSPLYHLNGQTWKPFPAPNVLNSTSIVAFAFPSDGEGWALGFYEPIANITRSVILHFQNGAWSIQSQ